jgi:histidinol-phosphate aminotransferase
MVIGIAIEEMVKPEILAASGYVAGKSREALKKEIEISLDDIIKLDSNENLYGCSPRVQAALGTNLHFNIYPDSEQTELRELLAGYTGVSPDNIVAGNGSDQLIEFIVNMFVGKGDEVINCVPSFDVFRFKTQIVGGTMVEVLRDENYNIDAEAVKAAVTDRTKLIVLASPNNPTGTLTPQPDILKIADLGLPFMVDEAYVEFSGETMTSYVAEYPNIMVLRTFSKWAGLAGIRIGFGIVPVGIADIIDKMRLSYNVNSAAVIAVRETLQDIDYLKANVARIVEERERLFSELNKIDFLKAFPSRANFIYCSVTRGSAAEIKAALETKGILIRYFDLPLLNNSLRIAVGKPEHTDAIIKALREIGEGISE